MWDLGRNQSLRLLWEIQNRELQENDHGIAIVAEELWSRFIKRFACLTTSHDILARAIDQPLRSKSKEEVEFKWQFTKEYIKEAEFVDMDNVLS